MARLCLKPDEFEILNSHTTVDAPETVYYIRQRFKEWREQGIKCEVRLPRDKDGHCITMWNLIPKKSMPPTRFVRYCCATLKEAATPNSIAAVGVREDESTNRGGRNDFSVRTGTSKNAPYADFNHIAEVMREDANMRKHFSLNTNEMVGDECTFVKAAKENKDMIVSPIYRWTEKDVWTYIRENKLPYNPLYDKGFYRVGCVGCPMGGHDHMVSEFSRYPKYRECYIHAFQRMIEKRKAEGKSFRNSWETGEDVYRWWIREDEYTVRGQIGLEDFLDEVDGD
jgi:phosphoadenosine phosphosulfate reductase